MLLITILSGVVHCAHVCSEHGSRDHFYFDDVLLECGCFSSSSRIIEVVASDSEGTPTGSETSMLYMVEGEFNSKILKDRYTLLSENLVDYFHIL